ncbi:hypothetical protein ASPVEDRAFT_47920 [Aspergillus versicolor CBS 583.65]|uniref:Major facilitator superfamily (MFS) profile domain-containing protein n=1 Tax=Aspergillus versicolor CBS 583.65 TaxID=1036611 RepID=A0A1L9Q4Q3_ASPVE|nr:uncharacterized protein ASPVEDRAFT_47920 [Aspergillus versicolor CBS 583.65]OJJ08747.1 hypothetical protein ASPVEDRAFT_47920 [Aspergillus versicolor CBS 583.65]
MSSNTTAKDFSAVNADKGSPGHESPPERGPVVVSQGEVDDTTYFYNVNKGNVRPLTPEIEGKIIRRNFWFLLGQTWWISFLIHLDKSSLSSASTMGIFRDVDMTKNEYNILFTLFYVGYLIALWPGAWLSQRVGHKQFITASLFLWAVLIGVHPAVRTGRQLMAVRFLLGMTESQVVPSTAILHQAFFPPKKSPWVQLLWWTAGSLANVLLTMVAYKLLKNESAGGLAGGISSWKWLHIMCAIITFTIFVPLVLFLPNSPVEAKWLSTEQKVHTIEIIRKTRAGITNSTVKWSQVHECFTDVKTWLFIFHMFFNELPSNTSAQVPLIIVGFGFTPAQSALFNVAKPLWGCALLLASAAMLYGTDLGTGYTCAISYLPCIIGGIIELSSPWSNKVALVVGTQISSFKPSYLLGLSWAGTTTTGHTKKVCLMSSCVVAAAVANMISPEFWQSKYSPRYVLPWSFMTAFWVISPGMCLIIRFYLDRENRRRKQLLAEQGDESERDEVMDTGSEIVKVGGGDLDLTDRQNLKFIYPL